MKVKVNLLAEGGKAFPVGRNGSQVLPIDDNVWDKEINKDDDGDRGDQ